MKKKKRNQANQLSAIRPSLNKHSLYLWLWGAKSKSFFCSTHQNLICFKVLPEKTFQLDRQVGETAQILVPSSGRVRPGVRWQAQAERGCHVSWMLLVYKLKRAAEADLTYKLNAEWECYCFVHTRYINFLANNYFFYQGDFLVV